MSKEELALLTGFVGGLIPALLWLWFWLREDKLHPEPRSIIVETFLAGMATVIFVIPIQKYALVLFGESTLTVTIWAATEEIFKVLAAYTIALRRRETDEPVDYMIYLITAALGFAALENGLFIGSTFLDRGLTDSIVTGNLRFVGATLLHILASGTVGAALAFSFYQGVSKKWVDLLLGLIVATALHTVFNSLIMRSIRLDNYSWLVAFVAVWGFLVILMGVFEKVKMIKMNPKKIYDSKS